ncbi:MAG: glycosyl hydrolase, partial [Mangrovibacterium sp.]
MKKLCLTLTLLLALITLGFGQYEYAFQDPDLAVEERVNQLVSLLTTEEKIGQMLYESPAIDRLCIPEYNWWNECLHG